MTAPTSQTEIHFRTADENAGTSPQHTVTLSMVQRGHAFCT
jgi:hypothetical protein